MVAVDTDFYLSQYRGTDPGQDLPRLLARASDDVDLATRLSIVDAELDAMQLSLVKKAVCAQAEFYTVNGDTFNEPQVAGSEQIGSFQRSTGYQQRVSPVALCPRSMLYLEQSGLTYRGVEVLL